VAIVARAGARRPRTWTRGNERKSFANSVDITDPIGILPRTTSGNTLGLCAHMSYSCATAIVVAAEEATRVTRVTYGATQIEPPAVYLQRIRTLTIPLTQQMRRPTSRLCPKFLSKDLRTVGVSVVVRTIPDPQGPMVHVPYKQSFRVHGD
jgi:hypothetical protein